MNILIAHNTADLYGASRSMLRMVCGLIKEPHAVTIVLPEDGPLVGELRRSGATVVIHPSLFLITRGMLREPWRIALAPWSVVFLMWLILRRRIALVHTNTALILSPAIAAMLARTPHVWHIREFFSEFPAIWPLHQRLMYFLSRRIIAVSQAVAGQFAAGLRDRVAVIHDGFPPEEFDGVTPDRVAAFRRAWAIDDDAPLIGVVGRIKWKRKGQEVLVRAAELLAGRWPKARFLLIGSPFRGNEDHLRRLSELVRCLGVQDRVICTGEVNDIKAAFAALDVVVLTSSQPEPFGGVVIEGMAMGKPVVATNIGGTPEQLEDGSSGLLVEPGNAHALADALEVLLSNPDLRERMGNRARQRFLANFTFAPSLERLRRVYCEAM